MNDGRREVEQGISWAVLGRWWFSLPSRVVWLEALGLGLTTIATLFLGTCLCLIFLPLMLSAEHALAVALGVSMVASLAALATLAWMACNWLCVDAFESNERAVFLLGQAGIPAGIDWHLSQAEQSFIHWLWDPEARREREARL